MIVVESTELFKRMEEAAWKYCFVKKSLTLHKCKKGWKHFSLIYPSFNIWTSFKRHTFNFGIFYSLIFRRGTSLRWTYSVGTFLKALFYIYWTWHFSLISIFFFLVSSFLSILSLVTCRASASCNHVPLIIMNLLWTYRVSKQVNLLSEQCTNMN